MRLNNRRQMVSQEQLARVGAGYNTSTADLRVARDSKKGAKCVGGGG
jgi:hypothetical protein